MRWIVAVLVLIVCVAKAQVIIGVYNPPVGNFQTPGPSLALYNSQPYYTCTANRYVSTSGLSTNSGTSPASPWDIATAESYAAPAGTCINLATGVYTGSGTNPFGLGNGGTGASKTGYVVWRCTTMPFSFVSGLLQGEGSGCVFRQIDANSGSLFAQVVSYIIFDGIEIDGNLAVFQASISGTTLDVTTMYSGTIIAGENISGQNFTTGPTIQTFGTGGTTGRGGTGTYALTGGSQTISSEVMNGTPVGNSCIDDEGSNSGHHHIWLLNMDIHGCGQSGVQLNQTDWLFAIHNVWHDNSSTNGSDGSGLSFYQPVGLNGYSSSPGNPDYWHSITTGRTYKMVITYNAGYHNYNNFSGSTDGEGIIMDDFDWGQAPGTCAAITGATCPYNGNVLIMGNAMWGNGGNGIGPVFMNGNECSPSPCTPTTSHIDIVNNTTYSNAWDMGNTGSFGAGLLINWGTHVTWINNIGYTISGSRMCVNAGFSCSILDENGIHDDVWQSNMAYVSGQTGLDGTNSYLTTGANKNYDGTDPKLTTLNPLLSTSATGAENFSLQSSSPAIGAGQAFDLWQQSGSVDIGACVHQVTRCP